MLLSISIIEYLNTRVKSHVKRIIDKIRLYDKMMNAQTIAVIANDAEQDLFFVCTAHEREKHKLHATKAIDCFASPHNTNTIHI